MYLPLITSALLDKRGNSVENANICFFAFLEANYSSSDKARLHGVQCLPDNVPPALAPQAKQRTEARVAATPIRIPMLFSSRLNSETTSDKADMMTRHRVQPSGGKRCIVYDMTFSSYCCRPCGWTAATPARSGILASTAEYASPRIRAPSASAAIQITRASTAKRVSEWL